MTLKPLGAYWFCQDCEYIFREPTERLAPTEEKARYDLHENVESPGYRAFYAPLLAALEAMSVKGQGLDYGCGPTAFLSRLLEERGFEGVRNYDPFFRREPAVLDAKYDFITCTEVFEHLREPRETFQKLSLLLRPGGLLLLMTSEPPTVPAAFESWSYRRDPTHIGFFSRRTFAAAAADGLHLVLAESPLWIFKLAP